MEKLQVTHARELCQLHGINIEPVEMMRQAVDKNGNTIELWGIYIKMSQGKKVKIGTRPYLRYTMRINGKNVLGWIDKIDQLWLHKARQIRKRLKQHQPQKQAA